MKQHNQRFELLSANLVSFQLPGKWAVCCNAFGDEDMVVEDGWISNFYHYKKEDLLWLQLMRRSEQADIVYELDPAGQLVDVGWYPNSDPYGAYAPRVFRGNSDLNQADWPAFCSHKRREVVAVLEYIIAKIGHLNEPEAVIRQRLVEL